MESELLLACLVAMGVALSLFWVGLRDWLASTHAHWLFTDVVFMLPVLAGLASFMVGLVTAGLQKRRHASARPPLCDAARSGDLGKVRLLLKDPSAERKELLRCDGFGRTALMHAAHEGHTHLLPLLLEHSTVWDVDENNMCALEMAVRQGHVSCVLPLASGYVSAMQKPHKEVERRIPLVFQIAIEAETSEILRVLLESGLEPQPDESGETLLQDAVLQGRVDMLRVILDQRAKKRTLPEGDESKAFSSALEDILFMIDKNDLSSELTQVLECADELFLWASDEQREKALGVAPPEALPKLRATVERQILGLALEGAASGHSFASGVAAGPQTQSPQDTSNPMQEGVASRAPARRL